MERVDGIPGFLPPLAPFPGRSIISSVLPEEWQACLDAWIFAVEFRLRLLPDHFRHFELSSNASGMPFLLSYYRQWDYDPKVDISYRPKDVKELKLHRQCFLLARRLVIETDLPYDCSQQDFFALIANISLALGANPSWKETLKMAWKRPKDQITAAIEMCKNPLIRELSSRWPSPPDTVLLDLRRATALTKALPEAGEFLMTGSDYLDSLATGYPRLPSG